MDLLNTLVDKGLRRELPSREEALAVLATSDDELLDVVAASRQGAAAVVRAPGETQLSGEPQVGPVPRGLLVLLAAARVQGGDPQVHVAQARRGVEGRGRRCRGRREAGLPGGVRARPDGPRRRPCLGDHRRDQGAERGRRGVRLPRSALRGPGRAAARSPAPTRTTTTSTPPRARTATSRRRTPTRTVSTRCRRPTRPVCPRAPGSSRAWARATRTWSTSSTRCANSTRTRCRSTS